MKRIVRLLRAGTSIIRKNKYRSSAALLVLILTIGTTAALVVIDRGTPQASVTKAPRTSKNTEPKENSTPQLATASPTEQPGTPSKTTSTAPKTPSSTSQKSLNISPSTFTVNAGSFSSPAISVQSSDGKGVNMPMFFSNPGGKFLLNFPAGPAKPSWSGNIFIYGHVPTGSYTLQIFAQDNSTAYYKGTITVNVVQPTMNISVQSHGYDSESDAVIYTVKIDRLYGFSEPVTDVAAYSTSEPGLGCYYVIADENTINMACGHDSGERPTSGTLTIEIITASLTRSATAAYSLPPLP